MNVRGYTTGEIDAAGAFTSDIDVPPQVTPGLLSTVVEADRPAVVHMPGLRHKYLPMRHDPATGALSGGGRYLFRTYADAIGFRDFLEGHTMSGESTTFWNRPAFINPIRYAWRVFGAYDLAPITEHHLNRFERYAAPHERFEVELAKLFDSILEEARRLCLAHVSLMYQPEHQLVGIVTAATRQGGRAPNAESVRHSADEFAMRGSVSEMLLTRHGARKIFDRTSLNLTIYLPLSEQAGGAPAIWPNSPPIPLPGVESLPPIQAARARESVS